MAVLDRLLAFTISTVKRRLNTLRSSAVMIYYDSEFQ